MYLHLSCLGCLAKKGSKEKISLPTSGVMKLNLVQLPVSGSSTELPSEGLREH